MNVRTSTLLLLAALGLTAGTAARAQTTIYAVANQAVIGDAGYQSYTNVRTTPGVTPPSNFGTDTSGSQAYLTAHDPTAPQGIFTTMIAGTATGQPFVFSGLTAGKTYVTSIDLAEDYFSDGNSRTFGLSINGVSALPNTFSIATEAYKEYGTQAGYANGYHEAILEQFNVAADSSGKINLLFVPANNQDLIGGIRIQNAPPSAAPEPSQMGLLAMMTFGVCGLVLRARKKQAVA